MVKIGRILIKSSQFEKGINLKQMFDNQEKGLCPFCGKEVKLDEFKDELSLKEFKISGLCQTCQDKIFS